MISPNNAFERPVTPLTLARGQRGIQVWLFGVFLWLEVGIAQALHAISGAVHFFIRFAAPVLDASLCGLVVGLSWGLVRVDARWLHIAIFFLAFYVVEVLISGPRVSALLIVASPFMWLFPLATWLVMLMSTRLKRRGFARA